MPSDDKYTVTLTGAQVDDALMQMNQRIPEGWAAGTRDGVAVSSTSQFYHNNAKYLATQAKSWAQGGTGERSGEDTNNAQYWAQQAQAAAGGGVSSFKGRTGAVQPQSGDYTPAMVGAMPADTSIPTKVSDLVNDQEFVTQSGLDAHYVTAGKASGVTVGSHATSEGQNTSATGADSHAEGNGTHATARHAHSEGHATSASGEASHAEGTQTDASGVSSHAEGRYTFAGGGTGATEGCAHAEGQYSRAYGIASHAEGGGSMAEGAASHAEGLYSKAKGRASHAEGATNANKAYQHTFGRANVEEAFTAEDDIGTYIEIVGNGSGSSSPSNARTLDWNGNEVLAGKLTVGAAPTANMDVATKKYVDDAIAAAIAALQNS